jgi:hypothetical protein
MKRKDLFWGTIFIFLLGSLLHFTYECSGNNSLVGIFSATNESVFEHTKLIIYPTILWYIITYLKNKQHYNKDTLFSSMIIQIIISIITIPMLFYFYTNAFGIESLTIDLLIFFISIVLGFIYANKYLKTNKTLSWPLILSIIIIMYLIGTFYPPNIPLFQAL